MREAVGEIDCPLCKRKAELHASESRQKLNPDGDQGKPAYPRKFYVVCPATTGYRGCGTIMANAPEAQSRMMEIGRIHGPRKGSAAEPHKPAPQSAQASVSAPAASDAASTSPAPRAAAAQAQPKPKKSPFSFW